MANMINQNSIQIDKFKQDLLGQDIGLYVYFSQLGIGALLTK